MKFVTAIITGSMLTLIATTVKDFLVPLLPAPESMYVSLVCDITLAIVPVLVLYGIIPAMKKLLGQ